MVELKWFLYVKKGKICVLKGVMIWVLRICIRVVECDDGMLMLL